MFLGEKRSKPAKTQQSVDKVLASIFLIPHGIIFIHPEHGEISIESIENRYQSKRPQFGKETGTASTALAPIDYFAFLDSKSGTLENISLKWGG